MSIHITSQSLVLDNTCDKCGLEVDPADDAIMLIIRAGGLDPMAAVFLRSRHLLPSDTCEGSPSRAQYLEGQPRDARGYEYHDVLEEPIRRAYAEMQEEARV